MHLSSLCLILLNTQTWHILTIYVHCSKYVKSITAVHRFAYVNSSYTLLDVASHFIMYYLLFHRLLIGKP